MIKEVIHSMKEEPEIICNQCGNKMARQISNSIGGFVIKGGTPTTHWKEKRNRMKAREALAVKEEAKRQSLPGIKPNIAGVETGSWSDAQKLAKESGLNAASYQPFVDKEKKSKISVVSAGTKV